MATKSIKAPRGFHWMKKKGGKIPPQLEPFVKKDKDKEEEVDEAHCGKRDPEDEKEEVDEGSCGKRDPEDKDEPKYAGSQDPDHDKAKELGADVNHLIDAAKFEAEMQKGN